MTEDEDASRPLDWLVLLLGTWFAPLMTLQMLRPRLGYFCSLLFWWSQSVSWPGGSSASPTTIQRPDCPIHAGAVPFSSPSLMSSWRESPWTSPSDAGSFASKAPAVGTLGCSDRGVPVLCAGPRRDRSRVRVERRDLAESLQHTVPEDAPRPGRYPLATLACAAFGGRPALRRRCRHQGGLEPRYGGLAADLLHVPALRGAATGRAQGRGLERTALDVSCGAAIVWFCAPFSCVLTYEAVKYFLYLPQPTTRARLWSGAQIPTR